MSWRLTNVLIRDDLMLLLDSSPEQPMDGNFSGANRVLASEESGEQAQSDGHRSSNQNYRSAINLSTTAYRIRKLTNFNFESLELAQIDYRFREKRNTQIPNLVDQDSLTSREMDILGLIALGLPSKQISSELGISLNTVNVHRSNIRTKLKIRTNAEFVLIAASLFKIQ